MPTSRASEWNSAGLGRDGSELGVGVGQPQALRRSRPVSGLLGRERATQARGEKARDPPAVGGILEQPRMVAAGDDERLDLPRRVLPGDPLEPTQVGRGHDLVEVAVGEQDRAGVPCERASGADVPDGVTPRAQVDVGRHERERVGDRIGDRQPGRGGRSAG